MTREVVLEQIIACAKVLDEADVRHQTCPDCGKYPVQTWKIVDEWIFWHECPDCGWNDRPDNIEVDYGQ